MKISHLQVNHLNNPLGYEFAYLNFSWKVEESKGTRARELRLLISRTEDFGRIEYDSDILTDYRKCQLAVSLTLKPRTRYFWKVWLKDDTGAECESVVAWFETAKEEEKWQAEWIKAPESRERMPLFYRDFSVDGELEQARLYITGVGLYETYLNDQKAGDEYLMPGYHSYDRMLEYQTWDITGLLQEGKNRISVLLGEGWYKGRFGFDDVYLDLYGDEKKFICELWLKYKNGREAWVYSDGCWSAVESCVGSNGIYDGEEVDDTAECRQLSVAKAKDDTQLLVARSNPPIHKVASFLPVTAEPCKEDTESLLLDFGESITGWVEFSGDFEAGQKIRLLYGEVLQEGKFYRENLRTAKAEFTYIADGKKKQVRPHFTYYGFRYVKVEGLKKGQQIDFTAYRLMSDIERTGEIVTSHERVNRLIDNTLRSQKCNFLDIPTDCPQRDERMGWTGDAGVFSGTAAFHMDCSAFFHHYMKNVYAEQQLCGGAVTFFAPRPKVPVGEKTNPFYLEAGPSLWGDAAVMIPWNLYRYYGDEAMLRAHYPAMKDWVDYVRGRMSENPVAYLWQQDRQLGDWLALDNGNIYNPMGKTDSGFLASAFAYQSIRDLTEAMKVLKMPEAQEYGEFAAKVKTAFIDFYYNEENELAIEETQTAYAVALYLGLYPEGLQNRLADRLEQLIAENGGHLNTGFAGTFLLCPALSEYGKNETAYGLLLAEGYPGWLHEVDMGATTVWERWNSLEEDGRISGTGMNSLNHYAYGSVAEWMYRYMCGFRPSMGDDICMTLAPMPDARIKSVAGSFQSVYGTYVCRWQYGEDGRVSYHMEVPFGANAKIVLPGGTQKEVGCGSYDFVS